MTRCPYPVTRLSKFSDGKVQDTVSHQARRLKFPLSDVCLLSVVLIWNALLSVSVMVIAIKLMWQFDQYGI